MLINSKYSMKTFLRKIKRLLYITFICLFLHQLTIYGQNRFAISIVGTYDFDRDGLSEFLAIDKVNQEDQYGTIVSFSEIDELGEHVLLWHYQIPKNVNYSLVDAEITDINGDDSPEIIVALNVLKPTDQKKESQTILMFEWSGREFPQQPTSTWNYLGTSSIAVFDALGEGDDELAVALGSPKRAISLLDADYSDGLLKLKQQATLTSKMLQSGYGYIYVAAMDYNQDNLIDLIAISPEINRTAVQVFENHGGEFFEGTARYIPAEDMRIPPGSVLSAGINVVDINQNGISDIILPSREGICISLEVDEESVTVSHLSEILCPLFLFSDEGISPPAINEILLERAELGVAAKKIVSLMPTEKPATTEKKLRAQVKRLSLTAIPGKTPTETEEGKKVEEETLGRVALSEIQKAQLTPISTEIEHIPVEDTTLSVPEEEEAEEEYDLSFSAKRTVQKVQLTAIKDGDTSEISPERIVIPPRIEISDTVLVGEMLFISLKPENGGSFYSFSWLSEVPEGVLFDSNTISIQWQPLPTQIGFYPLAYVVEYKVGEKFIDVGQPDEGTQVQKIKPILNRATFERYVLVKKQ